MSGATRKFDRNRKRSGSMARYRAENRSATNKKRKVAKHAKTAKKVLRIPRGTARKLRRAK